MFDQYDQESCHHHGTQYNTTLQYVSPYVAQLVYTIRLPYQVL